MKVIVSFEFTDEERQRITTYMRERADRKGLPKLATREMLRDWIREAIDCHWINVEDVESSIEERKREAV